MRFKPVFFNLLWLICLTANAAQNNRADSLKALVIASKEDTLRVNLLNELSYELFSVDPAEGIKYGTISRDLATKLHYPKGIAYALKNIGLAYYMQSDFLEVLYYWEQSLSTFESIHDKIGIGNLLNNLGTVYLNQGDDARALDLYLKSLRVSEEINDTLRIVTALINIGTVYLNNPASKDKALEFYLKALPLSEMIGNKGAIGTATANIGEIYFKRGSYTTALSYLEKSLEAYKGTGRIIYTLITVGKVYAKMGNYAMAIKYQQEALDFAKTLAAKLDMSRAYLGLGETYHKQGNISQALSNYLQAESLAREIGSNYELKDVYGGIASLYALLSDYKKAFEYHILFSDIKDTLFNIETDDKIKGLQFTYEIDKKQGEIDLLTKDKALKEVVIQKQKIMTRSVSIGLLLILVIAYIIYRNYRAKVKINIILDKQKLQIENLLLNILPQKVAAELQQTGQATPKFYESVSVLFTDFKGFTMIAETLSPQDLVAELNEVFFAIDGIIEKYNLEKIKTIGDSYMCAGGIPIENDSHPVNIVRAGLEIRDHIIGINHKKIEKGEFTWDLRLGIHTGPIVAGVVGRKKYAYDIWGNTVNIASRMESSGEPGRVNISADTYNLIKDHFHCQYRGKVSAKNIGEIDMYFVENEIESNAISSIL